MQASALAKPLLYSRLATRSDRPVGERWGRVAVLIEPGQYAFLGLPGLAGFWGEFMALLASYNPFGGLSLGVFRTAMVIGAVGTVLTAGYLLWMYQRVVLGEPSAFLLGLKHHLTDMTATEVLTLARKEGIRVTTAPRPQKAGPIRGDRHEGAQERMDDGRASTTEAIVRERQPLPLEGIGTINIGDGNFRSRNQVVIRHAFGVCGCYIHKVVMKQRVVLYRL